MNFFRHLAAAWLFLRNHPYVDAADHEDFWTKEDALAHKHYMNSPTGQKLALRLRNYMLRSAQQAIQPSGNQPYQCGWAAGTAATLATLDAHQISHVGAQSDEPEESELGSTGIFEQLAP